MEIPPFATDSGNSATPRVAVIVPAFGVAHLLGEALSSLQAQTFTDWECVVIDDGAPDDVAGAVAPFLADRRIRFVESANGGVSSARNLAVAHTTAPLVALLDGDDLFRPHYLATMVPLLESDPAMRLATCNARIFGAVPRERLCQPRPSGNIAGFRGDLARVLDRSFSVYIGTTFRRLDFEAVGGFDTTMTHSEDFDFWVRLMLLGGYAWYVNDVMGDYRVRAGSASGSMIRLLQGNIKVYSKARAALKADRPERLLIDRLIARQQDQLDFEQAIDRIIRGDTRAGIDQLRAARGVVGSAVWDLAFLLWRCLPGLASPMLSWRRRAHMRGSVSRPLFKRLVGQQG